MQRERQIVSSRTIGNAALAAVLALSLLAASWISVHHKLHVALHTGDAGHACLVCSLATGQVTAADIASVCVLFVAALLFCIPLLQRSHFTISDLRLPSGRAPPGRSSK